MTNMDLFPKCTKEKFLCWYQPRVVRRCSASGTTARPYRKPFYRRERLSKLEQMLYRSCSFRGTHRPTFVSMGRNRTSLSAETRSEERRVGKEGRSRGSRCL